MGTTLTPQEAGKVYDRIGRFQDWQSFYEGPATRDLEAHAGFDSAQSVFELGCGTGAYAARMLDHLLPSEATYHGVDVSEKMVAIASGRLQRFEDRARADLVSGEPPLPGSDGSFDRFLAIYVIDLLSHDLASCLLQEAHRLLGIGGRICLVSLAQGATRTARAVCSAWNATFGLSPSLVGGCRPVDLPALLDATWRVDHVSTLTSWAVTSQIVVAHPVGEDVRVFPVVLWAGVSPETCRERVHPRPRRDVMEPWRMHRLSANAGRTCVTDETGDRLHRPAPPISSR